MLPIFTRLFRQAGGDIGDFILAIGVYMGLHLENIHHAFKILLAADGQLDGDHPGAKVILGFGQGLCKVGVFPVHFVHKDNPGQGSFFCQKPNLFAAHLYPRHCAQGDQGRFNHPEGADNLSDKVKVARGIDKIKPVLLPFHRGDRRVDSYLFFYFV